MKRLMIAGMAVVLGCALLVSPAAVQPAAAQAKPVAPSKASAKKKKVENTAKQQDIHKLLVLSGSGDLGVQTMKQLTQIYSQMLPNVPQKFWEEFAKEVDANSLIELIVPIYDKHFTHEDVKGLIEFYQTPVGKKLIAVQPLLTQESQQAGEKWGMEIGQKVAERLKEEGYD